MKKRTAFAMTAVLLLGTACRGTGTDGGQAEAVDLVSLYAAMEAKCGWEEGYMADIEGDLLENYYPGLGEIPAKQLIAKTPAMSSDVNELVLMECEDSGGAEDAEAILQNRIDTQAGGGAWYAESMEAWEKAEVVRQGNYVAMVASAAHQAELTEDFNNAFE